MTKRNLKTRILSMILTLLINLAASLVGRQIQKRSAQGSR